jgi:hypothetical protein
MGSFTATVKSWLTAMVFFFTATVKSWLTAMGFFLTATVKRRDNG